ncbi:MULTISPECIES: peptidoglycan editing factor PgeF [unclassified Roseitalea]|uniref:peptidoglycan editing factor PgeF n=1 Tax=unclassified Roseitalea TaxID=2639107 RepID=UPI00273FEF08|nr:MULTISPECIES: peptidoglycan editing factor PgeF [unclassified Roseitalea]
MNQHTGTLPAPITAALGADRGVRHGFFTRQGGVSRGLYNALNAGLGSGDDPAAVHENRRRIALALGTDAPPTTCHQVHSADAVAIDAPLPLKARPKADALVTATPGLAIGILTADCAPVLFADARARVIGAAHAGWQGALAGVLENTVAAMEGLGAARTAIRAVIGPTIGQASYEVGPEFHDRFVAADPDNARWFAAGDAAGHHRFDLPGYCRMRLERAGIAARWTGQCTYGDPARFFSYRRATHRGESDYGRQMSAIVLA